MLRISRHGVIEILLGTVLLAGVGAALGWWLGWPWGLVVLPVWVWLIAFFRDPDRPIPQDPAAMVSPADGLVSDVGVVEDDEHLSGPVLRIGIFLSVFDVHVNRSPCDAQVLQTIYKKGKFINALRHDVASAENEANTLVLGDPATGRPIATVRQIVGLIARRIICEPKPGDRLQRGQRIGLIKFGSRTELCVPLWREPKATVKVGQKVRGAADVVCMVALDADPGDRGTSTAGRIHEPPVTIAPTDPAH